MSELYDLLHGIPQQVADGAGVAGDGDAAKHEDIDATKLFAPMTLRGIELKNRIVLDRISASTIPSSEGNPGEALISFYAERAAGGVGLILTQAVTVDWRRRQPTEDSVTTELLLNPGEAAEASWRDLLNRCHEHDCKVFLTLSAGAGRQGDPDSWGKHRRVPVSASRNVMSRDPKQKTWWLPDYSVRRLIKAFAETAKRAEAIGFDGIHIAADRGNLLAQFSDPMFNRRWLGRYKDSVNLLESILTEVRKAVGDDFPISLACDMDNGWRHCYRAEDFNDARKRYFKREEDPSLRIDHLKSWYKAGADCILPQFGSAETRWWYAPDTGCPDALYASYFQTLRAELPDIPFVFTGKIPDAEAAAAFPVQDHDLIAPTAALIADECWPEKIAEAAPIRPAIYSLRVASTDDETKVKVSGSPIERVFCSVNPRAGSEWMLPAPAPEAEHSKRIAVIGAGPAGVECAMTALERGHYVWLFDQQRDIGGFLNLVDAAPYQRDLRRYVDYMRERVDAEALNGKFRYHSWTIATMAMLEEHQLDAIVLADGSTEVIPDFSGSADAITYQAFLEDPVGITADKKHIVVAGSGDRLIDATFRIKYELGKQPTMVLTADRFEPDVLCRTMSRTHCLMRDRIPFYDNAVIERREEDKLFLSAHCPLNPMTAFLDRLVENAEMPNLLREAQVVDCDLLVYAAPLESRTDLYDLLADNAIAPEIIRIGDDRGHTTVEDAVLNGYRAAIAL